MKDSMHSILGREEPVIERAIRLCLYCMKTQIFIDGNKRAAIIFANHYMIKNGEGLLVVPESKVSEFKTLLISYYEGREDNTIVEFLKSECWRQF